MTLEQTGPWHRYLRKTFDTQFKPSLVHRYALQQQKSAVSFMGALLADSENYMDKMR